MTRIYKKKRCLLGPTATCLMFVCLLWTLISQAASPSLVVIDQDASGPGGSNLRSIMALLQSPKAKVLGIGVVTGNAWATDEVAHTLRMLELIGRRDVPVYKGATFPLVRGKTKTLAMQQFYGKASWLGAFGHGKTGGGGKPFKVGKLPEGEPQIKAKKESAAEFLIQAVRAHPGQVTIWAAGPLTDIALAQTLDPHFAEQAKRLVIMGGSISPHTQNPEFTTRPNHEFNFWFDPEAAHIVLNAPWKQIIDTSVDISLQAKFTSKMLDKLKGSSSPAAQYLVKYDNERYFMWDEIAALGWLYPDIITKHRQLYLDADISHGANYGNTIAWTKNSKPKNAGTVADVQMMLDVTRFDNIFIKLMRKNLKK